MHEINVIKAILLLSNFFCEEFLMWYVYTHMADLFHTFGVKVDGFFIN